MGSTNDPAPTVTSSLVRLVKATPAEVEQEAGSE
jgi:hypothetical protein